MNGTEWVRPFLGRIQDEHRELHRQVDALSESLERRNDGLTLGERRDLFRRQLTKLRDHLAEHFADEECGGCMEEALSYAPHLAPYSTELERQHPRLLHDLDAIQAQLSAGAPTADRLAQCAVEFDRFKQALLAHETQENDLLQRGFNVDLDLTEVKNEHPPQAH